MTASAYKSRCRFSLLELTLGFADAMNEVPVYYRYANEVSFF